MFWKWKHRMFENFRFRLFVKLFIFYIFVFLVPFLIYASFLSQYVMRGYKEEATELNSKATNYIRQTIDRNLSDIDVVALQLAESEEIIDFIQRTDLSDEEKPYYVWRVAQTIEKHCLYKDTIREIHIFAEGSDCVVTPTACYTQNEYFSKYLWNSGVSLTDWTAFLKNARVNASPMICKFSDGDDATAVIMRPGQRDRNGNIPILMVVLDKETILNTYTELASPEYLSYFGIASNKDILIQSGEPPIPFRPEALAQNHETVQEGSNGYVVFNSKSENLDLNYICMLPERQILHGVRQINLVLFIVITLVALLLLILVLVFSNKTFKPIKSLAFFEVGEKTYNFDSVEEFRGFLVNMIHSNSQLNEAVSRQQEYINHNFFKAFIQNSSTVDGEMLSAMLEETNITLKERYFRAAVVEFCESNFDNIDNFNIISCFQDVLKEYRIKHSVIPSVNGEIILLLAYDRGDERMREAFEKVVNHLEEKNHISAHISAGRGITSIDKFSKSYEDALLGLEKRTQKVSVFDKGSGMSYAEYFSFIKRDKLIYDIRQGNTEAVRNVLGMIMDSIFIKRTTTRGIQNYIMQLLDGVLKEALDAERSNDIWVKKCLHDSAQAISEQDAKKALEQIGGCFAEASRHIMEGKARKETDVIEQIVRYVDEHYANPDLTLKQIAEELNVTSYKYISEEFKRKTGMKFTDYLHSVRNNEAKRLLLTTDLKVFEISERVGYMGANAFVKIFKKLNGITPGKFRQSGKL